jgi:hypothetical protein
LVVQDLRILRVTGDLIDCRGDEIDGALAA